MKMGLWPPQSMSCSVPRCSFFLYLLICIIPLNGTSLRSLKSKGPQGRFRRATKCAQLLPRRRQFSYDLSAHGETFPSPSPRIAPRGIYPPPQVHGKEWRESALKKEEWSSPKFSQLYRESSFFGKQDLLNYLRLGITEFLHFSRFWTFIRLLYIKLLVAFFESCIPLFGLPEPRQ